MWPSAISATSRINRAAGGQIQIDGIRDCRKEAAILHNVFVCICKAGSFEKCENERSKIFKSELAMSQLALFTFLLNLSNSREQFRV